MQASNTLPPSNDPYLWLENVTGKKALQWVQTQNHRTQTNFAQSDSFHKTQADIQEVLDSNDKIPYVKKRNNYYYTIWTDKDHPRGVWKRTTLEEYRKEHPKWEVVLDIDELNKKEKTNWVWHGSTCLPPEYRYCLLSLSKGGSDADVQREFDTTTRTFVKNGFYRPEAKGSASWIDKDHLYIQTNFGPNTMTSSGYPRQTRIWTRGTPLQSAKLVYEVSKNDMSVDGERLHSPGYERDLITKTIDFYHNDIFVRDKSGQLHKIDVPTSIKKSVVRQWLTLEPREDWVVNNKTYPAGSYLVANLDDWLAGNHHVTVLFEPDEHRSLDEVIWTKDYVVLNILKDVLNQVQIFNIGDKQQNNWSSTPLTGFPDNTKISIDAVDSDNSNALWIAINGFTTPNSLYLQEIGQKAEKIKTTPSFFNDENYEVKQYFVTSKDGTRFPYFLIQRKNMVYDGKNPTILYGYGGFEVSLTPSYSGSIGRGWLERHTSDRHYGTYVVANIRGGGEYGPRWHQAALKANRYKAYEDFAAVAQDLINRKITSPQYLGAEGGSNGGLLMGNMLTQYPQLFGAFVIEVPLLDMKRYNKLLAGASWMAEYGNPDLPEEWKFIQTFSPYHLFDAKKQYPPVLFTTSTRDDRVHPAHARKMMAKMLDAGKNVFYYENTEGGHSSGADNKQRAYNNALTYEFLWQQLNH